MKRASARLWRAPPRFRGQTGMQPNAVVGQGAPLFAGHVVLPLGAAQDQQPGTTSPGAPGIGKYCKLCKRSSSCGRSCHLGGQEDLVTGYVVSASRAAPTRLPFSYIWAASMLVL